MPTDTYNKVTHCIFDMDGLLLDTERLYIEAFNCMTNRYGKEFTWEHKAQTTGFKTQDAHGYVIEVLELPLTPEEFKEIAGIYRKLSTHRSHAK